MRSSTTNRFIGVWDYDPKSDLSSSCEPAGHVWTLAEVAAAQTKNATAASQLGTYFWPIRPVHRGGGPTKATDRDADCPTTTNAIKSSPEIVDIYCGAPASLCASAQSISGCDSAPWQFKLGLQWEYSANSGATWFRLPDTARNLDGQKISIGMAVHRESAIVQPLVAQEALSSSSSASVTALNTQFYGIIDSVRISRGRARYTRQICQPYDPHAPASELIDDFVIFALNLGANPYRTPGGTVFPYYVKDRGWLIPGQPVYAPPDDDVIAPDLRNFYPSENTAQLVDNYNDSFSAPVLSLQAPPTLSLEQPLSLEQRSLPRLTTGGDPDFASVWLLLPMDGTNGSTTFTDASNNNRAISRYVNGPDSNIFISTAQSQWGGASGQFYISYGPDWQYYTNSYLSCSIPQNLLTTQNTQNWVIEFWLWPNMLDEAFGSIFSTSYYNTSSEQFLGLHCRLLNGVLTLLDGAYTGDFSYLGRLLIEGGSCPNGEWTYIAISYQSGVLRLYQDGQKIGETTATFASGSLLQIGNYIDPSLSEYGTPFNGHIDDFRITIGTNRGYTGTAIPIPVEAFPTSSGPATAPSAPRNVTADPGDAQISLSWLAPLSSGGSSVTGYIVEYTASGSTPATVSVSASPLSLNLTAAAHGITNNIEYSVRIAAVNAVGTGAYSAAVTVTPEPAPPPAAVVITSTQPDNERISLTWTAPNAYGATITNYSVKYTPAVGADVIVSTGSAATSYTITGLTNDVVYTLRVAAISTAGTGAYGPAVAATPELNPPDAYFANVSLLLHMEGSNNSTNFFDSSANSLTVTPNGNVVTSTAAQRFGEASALFDGNGDYLTIAPNAALSLGTADFTVECWVHFNALPSDFAGFANSVTSLTQADSRKWWFGYTRNEGLMFGRHAQEGPNAYAAWSPTLGIWYHVAACRVAGEMKLYIDGVAQTVVNKNTITGNDWNNDGLSIGVVATPKYFNGNIDDFRLTKNVARYTQAVESISSRPFPDYGPLSTLPPPPTNILPQPDLGTIFTVWEKPTNTGGAAFLGYKFKYVPLGGNPVIVDLPTSAVNYSLTGLINGTQYSISIAAVNAVGVGAYSTPITVTPSDNPPDAYFADVLLLLPADGTNGSKNLLDYSPNSFTFTTYNNAAISTAEDQFGGASLKLTRSSSDYVSVNEKALTAALLTSDFTMECWFYATADGGTSCLMTTRHEPFAGESSGKIFCVGASRLYGDDWRQPKIWCGAWEDYWRAGIEGPSFDLNTWYHVAMTVKTNGEMKLYVDGVLAGTTTGAILNGSRPMNELLIGRRWDTFSGMYFDGYIDDVRVSKRLRYSSNFTPRTRAFSNYGLFSAVPAAPNVIGARAANSRLVIMWQKPSDNGGAGLLRYKLKYIAGTAAPVVIDLPITPTSYELSNLTNDTVYKLQVAAENVIGVGAYSAEITATPQAISVDEYFDNVSLLLPMTGANNGTVFEDFSIHVHTVGRAGDAKISTTQTKFGSALYLDGTDDYLSVPAHPAFNMGTGDCTVEFWTFCSSQPRSYPQYIGSSGGSWGAGQSTLRFDESGADKQWIFYLHPTEIFRSPAVASFNQWRHIALVRQAGRWRLYIDGVQVATSTAGTATNFNLGHSGFLRIGGGNWDGTNSYAQDYIDDVRITKGICRYPDGTSFVPPIEAFPARGPTVGPPSRPRRVSAQTKDGALLLSWYTPEITGGVRILGYVIEYTPYGGTPTLITRNNTSLSYLLPGLTNGVQYSIRVAAFNEFDQGPFSFAVPATPSPNDINYIDFRKYLTYSNPDAGYRGKCGIQFPNTFIDINSGAVQPLLIAQALVLEEGILPPKTTNKRLIYADCATTEELVADADGKFFGKQRTFDTFTTNVNRRIFVKDQSDAYLNGVYVVQENVTSGTGNSLVTTLVPWSRLPLGANTLDDYFGARVLVLNGKQNVGTVWNCDNESPPTIEETPVLFSRENILGLNREDFCVEAYFKAHSFRQPPLFTAGRNMTLLDTYYRVDQKDLEASAYSGVRIYFSAELSGKMGRVLVDVGTYDQKINEASPTDSQSNGPALRSKLLSAGVFYHVAVTRADDTFRLYIDGELQDQFLSQDQKFAPINFTNEQNHIRYRVRPYFALNDYSGQHTETDINNRHVGSYATFNVRRSEFYFKNEGIPVYAKRFNGAAGMVASTENDLVNLPVFPSIQATWPGRPIPDYPADVHVYIMRNLNRQSVGELNFSVWPNLRFPPETTIVELATVDNTATYQPGSAACGSNCPPIPNRGNIALSGLFASGARATGTAQFVFSATGEFAILPTITLAANGVNFNPQAKYKVVQKTQSQALARTEGKVVFVLASNAQFTILNTTVLTANGFTFNPKATYTAVAKPIETELAANELRIVPHTEPNKYQVVVPVIAANAQTTSAIVAQGTAITTTTNFASLVGAFAEAAFESELRIEFENPNYVVAVPVVAQTRTADGNISVNTEFDFTGGSFDPAIRGESLVRVYAGNSFQNGAEDSLDPLTIDGVPVENGMRILVKDQTNKRENGIYIARVGAWERASDMNTSASISGANRTRRIFVNGGYTNANDAFVLDVGSVADAAIVIGVTNIEFDKDTANTNTTEPFIAVAQTSTSVGPDDPVGGVQVADEVAHSVTCVSTANLSLSGIPPRAHTDNYEVAIGDSVLVKAQTNPAENGVYTVRTNEWQRISQLSVGRQFPRELLVSPVRGDSVPKNTNGDATGTVAYRMIVPENFILGTTAITFGNKVWLDRLHLPFVWSNVPAVVPPNSQTGLSTITAGELKWKDLIPDSTNAANSTSNDKVSWRVRFQCGKTVAYSRTIVLRSASKLGISQVSPTRSTS